MWREDESELIPYCLSEHIGWIPYSPMGRGLLCGADQLAEGGRTERLRTDQWIGRWYNRDADLAVGRAVDEVAARHGASPAQVALAWVLHRSARVAPIFGADTPQQVDEAVAALELKLEGADEACLVEHYQPRLRALVPSQD